MVLTQKKKVQNIFGQRNSTDETPYRMSAYKKDFDRIEHLVIKQR